MRLNLRKLCPHKKDGQVSHGSDLTKRVFTTPAFDAAGCCPVIAQKARHSVVWNIQERLSGIQMVLRQAQYANPPSPLLNAAVYSQTFWSYDLYAANIMSFGRLNGHVN